MPSIVVCVVVGNRVPLPGTTTASAAKAPARADAPQGDKDLEGVWEARSFIHDGKDEPQAPGKVLLTFRGDALTLRVGDEVRKASVTVDAGKTPHTIDMAYRSGPDKGRTVRGLYEVKGDELRICHGEAGAPRPSEIASREGGGYSVGVWKRVKAGPGEAREATVVRTGIRVVATIRVLPGRPTAEPPPPVPDAGAAVKVFSADGRKPVAEGKTDGKGMWAVELPPGKYRVEVEPTTGPSSAPPVRVEVKEGELSEAAFRFVIALR